MRSTRSVIVAQPVRTAIGTFDGSRKDVPATALGATAIRSRLARGNVELADGETVVMGNVVPAGNKMNPARQAVAVAGGMENVQRAPYLIARGRWRYRMGDARFYDSMSRRGPNDAFSDEASPGRHTEGPVAIVEGGSVAHGHPIGATGAGLTTGLLRPMRRDRLRRGIVTTRIGGGQGIALASETIA